ncbi:hypothetical protein [Jiella pacifica]|uniref:Uncharacterized protein n=1 Tax=Jiella pacifica TaxID=2696469 RepID=A0A6N9T7X1_9HYPH|nr:hypothetical protein [Jiella pacifica]NDW06662.1 hypothetical protein [Jiella pacifica]
MGATRIPVLGDLGLDRIVRGRVFAMAAHHGLAAASKTSCGNPRSTALLRGQGHDASW